MQPAHDTLEGKLLMVELRRVCGDFADDVGFCRINGLDQRKQQKKGGGACQPSSVTSGERSHDGWIISHRAPRRLRSYCRNGTAKSTARAMAARRFPLPVRKWYNPGERDWGVNLMVLTLGDLKFLKELKAAGDLGRNVRELTIRITLDRLVKGGYLVGRPTDRHSVQYRITQRGRDAIAEHDF
jgi:hypothetical protein